MSDPRLKPVLDNLKNLMDAAVDHATNEFTKIRAGKSHPSMIDSVKVDYYGQLVPVSQIANISTPDAKSISIQPWKRICYKPLKKE